MVGCTVGDCIGERTRGGNRVSAEFTNQAPCIEKRVVKGLKGFVRVRLQGVRCVNIPERSKERLERGRGCETDSLTQGVDHGSESLTR
jgi:hypothetical protein